ncbi:MAG: hypothetical protein COA45_10390 [Zetaproteobacteria bacterium]|nr:MAG: hypothetical protein COA45_10390 [Zetaproteobacteria bacterium]
MTEYPRVKLQSLDKITAHTMTFEADVGSTLKFGPLYMKVQSCQKSSPIDDPESAAFIQVWEGGTEGTAKWVFSGWMFASSPGLSPMDHPIYDVWVIDCLAKKEEGEEIEDATNTDTENNDDKSTPKPSPETGDMLE